MRKVLGMLCVGVLGLTPHAIQAQSGSSSSKVASSRSQISRTVTGPERNMNEAVAAGATATITMKPVPPKTVPASHYPMGSAIMGQTLILGTVPARAWFEIQVTNWAPEIPRTFAVYLDSADLDSDGGGFDGSTATCQGAPMVGAGGLRPAMQTCSVNADCRTTISGTASPCGVGEPSRCINWDGVSPGNYFPPGRWCEPAFQDKCDPQWIGTGIVVTPAVSLDGDFFAWAGVADPGEVFPDFAPSYLGTLVLEVPADASGKYILDFNDQQTFIQNNNSPPDNNIPIAAMNSAVIQVVSCATNMDCNDNDACTEDVCQGEGCCTHTPVAGWNPATECCNPTNGVQAAIPPSTSCRLGGCTLGGSSGVPTQTSLADGTACASSDPCYSDGLCNAGQCVGQQFAGSSCPKPRFISFEIGTDSTPMAYRVRMVSLHHPDPPYTGGAAADFSAYEGLYRWVGPPGTYVESSANLTPVHAAFVDCTPHYQDWSTIELLHVSGAEIVPSSVYEIQSIAEGLDPGVEANYSPPVTVVTSRWGDTVIPYSPPSFTTQPDAGDHAALVDKFRSWPNAMSKPRAMLVGSGVSGIPDIGSDVSFADISATIDAFKGRPYPFEGPIPCP